MNTNTFKSSVAAAVAGNVNASAADVRTGAAIILACFHRCVWGDEIVDFATAEAEVRAMVKAETVRSAFDGAKWGNLFPKMWRAAVKFASVMPDHAAFAEAREAETVEAAQARIVILLDGLAITNGNRFTIWAEKPTCDAITKGDLSTFGPNGKAAARAKAQAEAEAAKAAAEAERKAREEAAAKAAADKAEAAAKAEAAKAAHSPDDADAKAHDRNAETAANAKSNAPDPVEKTGGNVADPAKAAGRNGALSDAERAERNRKAALQLVRNATDKAWLQEMANAITARLAAIADAEAAAAKAAA